MADRPMPTLFISHGSPLHFLPLFAMLGAVFDGEQGARIHSSYDRGLLSLDAYAFGFDESASARQRTVGASAAEGLR